MIGRAVATLAVLAGTAFAAPRTVNVGPGVYRPAFPATPDEREVPVARFRLDVHPVTNAEFLAFVRTKPEWQRGRIKPLLADAQYLAHWQGPTDLGDARPNGPVIRVSWFAARAFCAARNGRLPVEREWELAAEGANEGELLGWYTQATPAVLPAVGGAPNAWGARDMHGLVWEWIEDFNAAMIANDSRTPDRNVFCGGAGATARDAKAYATFMRIAFRSSLEARFTTSSLGFRCAYDLES